MLGSIDLGPQKTEPLFPGSQFNIRNKGVGLCSWSRRRPANHHLSCACISAAVVWKNKEIILGWDEVMFQSHYFLLLEFIAKELPDFKKLTFCTINFRHKILGGNGLYPLIRLFEGCNSPGAN